MDTIILVSARPFYSITTADILNIFYYTLNYVNLIVLRVMNFNK